MQASDKMWTKIITGRQVGSGKRQFCENNLCCQVPQLGSPYICIRPGLRARGVALEAGKKIAAQWNMYSIFVDAIASLAPPIFQSVGLEVGQSVTLSDSVCVGGGPTNLI